MWIDHCVETCAADGNYEVWLVLDTNTLMESPEDLLAFHAASKDNILPKAGACKNIDLSINYYVPMAVIRELDNRKVAGHADGKSQVLESRKCNFTRAHGVPGMKATSRDRNSNASLVLSLCCLPLVTAACNMQMPVGALQRKHGLRQGCWMALSSAPLYPRAAMTAARHELDPVHDCYSLRNYAECCERHTKSIAVPAGRV